MSYFCSWNPGVRIWIGAAADCVAKPIYSHKLEGSPPPTPGVSPLEKVLLLITLILHDPIFYTTIVPRVVANKVMQDSYRQ